MANCFDRYQYTTFASYFSTIVEDMHRSSLCAYSRHSSTLEQVFSVAGLSCTGELSVSIVFAPEVRLKSPPITLQDISV
jgi:hypothetical protein